MSAMHMPSNSNKDAVIKTAIFTTPLICITLILIFSPLNANALTEGNYTYSVSNNVATITAFDATYSGELTIVNSLGGHIVTTIGTKAFRNCYKLTNVTIPEGVTSIGTYAFSYCRGLTNLVIPVGVTTIEDNTCFACNKLTNVTIPEGVTSIGSSAFEGCEGLSRITIPDSVTSIGSLAFRSCRGLTSITIPDSVTSIGSAAFYGCNRLTSITIPDSVTNIGSSAFGYCALNSVVIPNSVTSIGNSTFANCTGLTSVTIPGSVTSIGSSAFSYCYGLTNVLLPNNVTSIGDSAFLGCSRLSSVTLPNNIISLANSLFYRCYSLQSIAIPDSVTSIGSSAFSECTNMVSLTIPESVTNIGSYAFSCCFGLTNIVIPESVVGIGDAAFYRCIKLTSIIIPKSVASIGSSAFLGCDALTSVTIRSISTSIGDRAFGNCLGLPSIELSNGITSIGTRAFESCTNLSSVTISGSVTNIGVRAFGECSKLTAINVDGANADYCSVNGILFSKNRATIFACPLGLGKTLSNYTIPSSVAVIGESAFQGCSGLTSITLPEGVTNIGANAFRDCYGLTSITIPDAVTSVGSSAFQGCSGLTSITLPEGVTNIGSSAFLDCFNLMNVTIPNSVTSIGNSAFSGCVSLTSVKIPDNVTDIGASVFYCCNGLTSVTIGRSVKSIGESAFQHCNRLTSVTIPDSVTSITEAAFSFCIRLTSVYFMGNAPRIIQIGAYYDGIFWAGGANITIYYLPGKTGWTDRFDEMPAVCNVLYYYPYIIANPTNLSAVAGTSASFSVSVGGADPKNYQWRKAGSDIPGATDATLTLGSVSLSDSGRYSVHISNAYASINSASAKLTVLGGAQYSQDMCRMPDPVPFEKLPGQNSLIVITHGVQPKNVFADLSWMENMADAIRANLLSQGKSNWRVETFNWAYAASVEPDTALIVGNTLGSLLGMDLGNKSWQHIHLIGHSAGSAVIQASTEWIKYLSPETTVHTTFLDPYTGYTTVIGRLWYGLHADWADNYFSDDWTGSSTGGRLLHAHNVNVTQLDPDHTRGLPCFYSGSEMPSSTPAVVSSEWNHSYPHDFYLSTIELRCSPEAEGYGFSLSKEGGGWDKHATYMRGNDPKMLGAPAVCLPDAVVGSATGTAFNFSSLTRATSATGATVLSSALQLSCIQSTPNGLGMLSFSQGLGTLSENANTAWLSVAVTVTDIVNFVTFDISFASPANAQGLLTVYWETNVVGTVDERTVMAATESYRFPLPENYAAGTYALGFRLDSFTNIMSSVTVTNVAAGFAGNTTPMSLDVATTTKGMLMTLSAPSQQNYLVQASTNLVDWSPFAILANTNGTVRFYDPAMPNFKQRFYRAVKQ